MKIGSPKIEIEAEDVNCAHGILGEAWRNTDVKMSPEESSKTYKHLADNLQLHIQRVAQIAFDKGVEFGRKNT